MEPTLNSLLSDTIAAVSTPRGEGGIAVIRISGPQTFEVCSRFWKGKTLGDCPTSTAHLGYILDGDGKPLDQALATVFRAPASFTGEDTVELSVHGGRWLQKAVLHRVVESGARPAGPGEFSQKAFLNGRLDLSQAEGIADLIAAGSKAAARLAITQTSGQFSRKLNQLRDSLIDFAAMLELELDFSEEEVEFADRTRLRELCDHTIEVVGKLASSFKTGRLFKEGVPVVIAGAPNAGKSTLLNSLSDDDLAIVSDIPGTTRDIIESQIEIDGTLFRFYDTAGIRDNAAEIESQGIERARKKISQAAILIWMTDISTIPTGTSDEELQSLNPLRLLTQLAAAELPADTRKILVLNKSDLVAPAFIARLSRAWSSEPPEDVETSSPSVQKVSSLGDAVDSTMLVNDGSYLGEVVDPVVLLPISAKSGEGVEDLKRVLTAGLTAETASDDELIVSNARHYEALLRAHEALERSRTALLDGLSADFVAQDVREAITHLSAITGAITPDALLHTLFSRFCIGK